MASIHLSKILPTKKSTADIEQENFEKWQTISINKALNPTEAPLKVKHARAAIIGTHRCRGGQSFWAVAARQPVMDNRFAAWKFCHLLHKVLREGHPLCLQHSIRHKKWLLEVGKMWGHLTTDDLGICIKNYTKLLVTKIEFHDRNPRFPGNLLLAVNELEQIGGNDINFYFQLAVEIFDYLDDIIALQAVIFHSINTFHTTSMSAPGQCRLAPCIPLIQDSNPLYDFSVRLMFKLHLRLPNDILAGHRERFRTIFKELKSFYDRVSPLQYFTGLIQVPKLPDHAPNFNSSVDFGSYVAPVVVVEPEPEPIVDLNLVDISIPDDRSNNHHSTPEPPPQINFEKLLQERDNLIRELQVEIDRLGKCLRSMAISHREQMNEQEERISRLNTQLAEANEELVNMRLKKEELELKAQLAPTLEQKAIAVEERAKASEEKFQKLKAMYTQIRDEHVKLLRQHGETTKLFSSTKRENSELATEKEMLRAQLEEYHQKQTKTEEELQKTMVAAKNEKEITEKYEKLHQNYEELKMHYDVLQADKCAEIAELRIKIDHLEQVRKDHEILSVKYENLEASSRNVEGTKNDLEKRIEKIIEDRDEVDKKKQEIECILVDVRRDVDSKSAEISKLQEEMRSVIVDKDREIKSLHETIKETEEKFQTTNANLDRLCAEKSTIECDFHDLLVQQAELDEKYKNALQTIAALESSLQDCKIHGDASIRALLEACIKSSEKLAVRAMSENDFTHATGTSSYFMMLAEELQEVLNELKIVYLKYKEDNSLVEGLARKTVLTGHLLASVQIQGMTICNTSADIECGERIANEIKLFCNDITNLFESLLQLPALNQIEPKITIVKQKLSEITNMIHDLTSKSDKSGQLGDLVESELASMDKAIEEAAAKIVEMLSIARKSNSGIKLEVNEKILDACTNLMQSIRILVQKSKILQAEIVSIGKGTASAKEFYKRNHQWTEGLISASKSVAQGANLLVTAANKAVSGEAKHHLDLVVAAQEIAACTAQLVVASRVKAPRGSQNLQALSTASRNVTQSTGAVVATAKNCSQQLEDSEELDLTQLTVHQAKTLEMEIQVKVLELEQALQMERLRLAAFRRKNYQNSDYK